MSHLAEGYTLVGSSHVQNTTRPYTRVSRTRASHTGFFISGSITIDPALISGLSSAAKGHHRCHSPETLLITTWRALQVGTLGPIVRCVFSTRSCWGTFPSKLVSASAGALPKHYQGHRAANRPSQASEELSVPAQATEQLSGRVCIAERGGVSCQALPDGSRDSVWDLAGGHVLAHVTYVSEHSPMPQ